MFEILLISIDSSILDAPGHKNYVPPGKATPKNKALYSRVKAEAKRKFDVYPSAYANAWLVKTYKKRGGTYA